MKKIISYNMLDWGKFTLGRVVQLRTATDSYLGHITGFKLVELDTYFDTVVMVKWCDGQEYAVHPTDVILL